MSELAGLVEQEGLTDVQNHGKVKRQKQVYPITGGRNWYGIIDETKEAYAYPPDLFEIVE